jgi:F-type H+-transporting ATPase subunit a
MFFFADPLEQFSIEISTGYLHSFFSIFNYSYNIHMPICKMIFFNFLLVIFFMLSVKEVFISNKLQKIVVMLFNFVTNIVKDAISIKKYSFILLFYVVFLFIFLSNILGMIPYSMTITSHLILTLYFSLAFFIGNNLIGICYHKENFFVLFLPEGVPVVIIPFLILIEYVSYISRIFSLAIRLFANMLSGHILLKILICFI